MASSMLRQRPWMTALLVLVTPCSGFSLFNVSSCAAAPAANDVHLCTRHARPYARRNPSPANMTAGLTTSTLAAADVSCEHAADPCGSPSAAATPWSAPSPVPEPRPDRAVPSATYRATHRPTHRESTCVTSSFLPLAVQEGAQGLLRAIRLFDIGR